MAKKVVRATKAAIGKKKEDKNIYRSRLAGTPFKKASDYNKAQDRLLQDEWEQLERARIRRDLLQRDEYRYILERFEHGLSCDFGDSNDKLFRIFVDGKGYTQVALSEKLKNENASAETLSLLIRALTDAFEKNYLKVMKILPVSDDENFD